MTYPLPSFPAAPKPTSSRDILDFIDSMPRTIRGKNVFELTNLLRRLANELEIYESTIHDLRSRLEAAESELRHRRSGTLADHSLQSPDAQYLMHQHKTAMQQGDQITEAATAQAASIVAAAEMHAAELRRQSDHWHERQAESSTLRRMAEWLSQLSEAIDSTRHVLDEQIASMDSPTSPSRGV